MKTQAQTESGQAANGDFVVVTYSICNRPAVAVHPDGTIVVSWLQNKGPGTADAQLANTGEAPPVSLRLRRGLVG